VTPQPKQTHAIVAIAAQKRDLPTITSFRTGCVPIVMANSPSFAMLRIPALEIRDTVEQMN
jgi:hypothetical protein